jgi:hypothetical protein
LFCFVFPFFFRLYFNMWRIGERGKRDRDVDTQRTQTHTHTTKFKSRLLPPRQRDKTKRWTFQHFPSQILSSSLWPASNRTQSQTHICQCALVVHLPKGLKTSRRERPWWGPNESRTPPLKTLVDFVSWCNNGTLKVINKWPRNREKELDGIDYKEESLFMHSPSEKW